MKICALINPESGSTPDNSEALLQDELRSMGLTAEIFHSGAGELQNAVHDALAAAPDVIIVWGGDGSVACALTSSGPSGPPILALPGGTMNLVHKRLHGTLTDWREILHSALSSPTSQPFAAGSVAEHKFFVAAMLGQVTSLAESREAARHGQMLKAAELAIQSDAMSVERRLSLESMHASGNQKFDAVAAAVVIGDNVQPKLEVAAIDPQSKFEWISIAVDALLHGWREAESIELDETRTVTITEIEGLAFPATIDGETISMPSGTTIRLERHAANVLRARPG